MPPIPAVTASYTASEAPMLPGLAPEGFADALLAFLSPESLPTISLDDALPLGRIDGRSLRIPGLTNPFDPSKPIDARTSEEPDSELDPLLAMAVFPMTMPIAPTPPAL